MAARSVIDTYDDWASFYHRMYPTPGHGIEEARRALAATLPDSVSPGKSALDVGCGTGFSTAALARFGYRVTGWDISIKSLARARAMLQAMGLPAEFNRVDILSPPRDDTGHFEFDVVIALASVIAHFETEGAQGRAIANLAGLVAPGGCLVLGLHDYERLLRMEPDDAIGEWTIIHQSDGEIVHARRRTWRGNPRERLHTSIYYQILDGHELHVIETRYRAITFMEVTEVLSRAGMVDVRWLQPVSTGYYQPLCIARRPLTSERPAHDGGRRIVVHRVQRRRTPE